MNLNDLSRLIGLCFKVCLGAALLSWLFFGPDVGKGVLIGGLAATLNLWILQRFFVEFLSQRRASNLMWLTILKVPLFYGAGAWVLFAVEFSVLSAVLAFQAPFLMAIVEARRCRDNPNEFPAADAASTMKDATE